MSPDGDRPGILIAVEDPAFRDELRRALAEDGRDLYPVGSLLEFDRVLRDHEITLVLLDLILPDAEGRRLLGRLRENPLTAALPVIVISGRFGPNAESECFALGAIGFFRKPVDLPVLRSAVSAQLARETRIRRDLRHDPLTGLLNRAAFCEGFQRAVSQADRERQPISLGFFDLDHFKQINDTFGHALGDRVLRQAAARVGQTVRKSDLLARWGGDEFAVLFPNAGPHGAGRAMEQALENLRQESFRADDGRTFEITFSAGVVDIPPGTTVDEAVASADRLLYRAKELGRNRVVSSDDGAVGEKIKVLVAEDEYLIAVMVRQVLEKAGFEMLHCKDGPTALETASWPGVSLVVLDVHMPGLDGFEVLRKLRSSPATTRLPVMLFTSMGNERDIVRGFEMGADDYVVKPLIPGEFVARIRRLLRRR